MRALIAFGVVLAIGPLAPAADPTEFTLKNGFRVRLVPDEKAKEAAVVLLVRAGILHEPAGRPHVAHVTEHLAVFDCKFDAADRKLLDGWYKTGKANGETNTEAMFFDLHVPSEEVLAAVRVQAARLGAVEFTSETLGREVPRTLREIDFTEQAKATGKFALCPFVQAAFHGSTDVPVREVTTKLVLKDATAFHQETFSPDRAMLLVVGAFDAKSVRKEVEDRFGGIKHQPEAKRPALKAGAHAATWDVAARHVLVAWPTPAATDADHPALSLAAGLLMTQMFADAAVPKLTDMPIVSNDSDGVFLVNVQLKDRADAAEATKAIHAQVAKLAAAKTLNPEYARRLYQPADVKQLDTFPLPKHITRAMALANLELQPAMRSLAWGDAAAYRKRLGEVTADAVRAAIGKHLTETAACVVTVSPKKGK
jgi:predicted Zn-dependent peptidase